MTDEGLDYAWPPHPDLDQAWAAGYRFVSRYFSYDTTGKNLTASELQALRAKGFEVMANWEWFGDWRDYGGGATTGRQQAIDAIAQGRATGYATGCSIYHSVDFDPTDQQLATGVHGYAAAYQDEMHAAGFRSGGYGGYHTIKYLFDNGLIDDGWQTYAWSMFADYAGGPIYLHWDARAAIRQDNNGITVGGAQCDHNTRVGQTYLMGQATSTVEDKMYFCINANGDGAVWLADGIRRRSMADQAEIQQWLDLGAKRIEVPTAADLDRYGHVASGAPSAVVDLAAIAKAVNDDAAARLAQ